MVDQWWPKWPRWSTPNKWGTPTYPPTNPDYRFPIDLNPDYRDLYESDSNSTSSCAGYEDWTRLDAMVHNITHIRPLCTYYKYIPTYSTYVWHISSMFQHMFRTKIGHFRTFFKPSNPLFFDHTGMYVTIYWKYVRASLKYWTTQAYPPRFRGSVVFGKCPNIWYNIWNMLHIFVISSIFEVCLNTL